MSGILASMIDGLLIGSVYGLAAMGLSLIWGVMDVINLTHGAVIALGMFAMYLLFTALHLNAYLLLLPIIAMGLIFGTLVYWTSVHWVIDRPQLSSLLSTCADDDHVHSEGGEQARQLRAVDDPMHRRPVHQRAKDQPHCDNRQQQEVGVQMEGCEQQIHGEHAQRDDRPMGEIDDIHDSPDEAQSHRRQSVHRTDEQAVDHGR